MSEALAKDGIDAPSIEDIPQKEVAGGLVAYMPLFVKSKLRFELLSS